MAYRIRPSKPFTQEFCSVARKQIDRAVASLSDQPEGPHAAVHAARKRFKRLRALYRLVEPDARAFRKQENERIRIMAKTLSTVRDATALVETVDYLAGRAASADEFSALSQAARGLMERRDRIAGEEQDLPEKIAHAIETCQAARAVLASLDVDDGKSRTAKRMGKVWTRQHRKACQALAHCLDSHDAEAFHDLRKRGQVYWMHLSLLQDLWPSAMLAKHAQAKHLVDLLGHEHDLSVLTETVNENPDQFGSSETLATLIAAIISRQQALRQEALELAQQVFAEDSRQEGRLIEILWAEAA
ncbi:CHAD domain-containing protein [Rhizobium sp. SSA_523]|uniref:CHAD domain-containing protein n=1 Tax=Rhizobium sp. SSA_523 TaxID=2952477 RepID=UPI002091E33E|nr:CHAD domain-containing protein [Rhizobium sp. SSA_523]MCO5731823.1 CHAD domain-containing protein [Rhizobium sp. SSA_523]WKC22813.1 CHAD domain-containing protein [Rhizobium sp. SSA_523]